VISCAVPIVNSLGLHARAAARFVHAASAFRCRIRVARGTREIDGKSIMGLLLLSAAQGSVITISADGADEGDAIAALCALVERGFDEAPVDSAQGEPPAAQGGPDGAQGGPCA
jgi:phosphocarrier protein HPr